MKTETVQLLEEFSVEHCCNCGIAFAIPTGLEERLRETHRHFFCPNGHEQWYVAQTQADRLKAELAAEQRKHAQTQNALAAAIHEHARLQKRIGAGVCPCCNRTFENLARHMQSKHKSGYALPEPAKRITA